MTVGYAIIQSFVGSERRCAQSAYGEQRMSDKNVSIQTLRRLPVYLHYLKSVSGATYVSATAIAEALGLNDVQVRKDLGSVSGSGRPKKGYVTEELIAELENYLGCDSRTPAVLIGAGNLGKALLSYGGFSDYGLEIVAAFDIQPATVGSRIGGKPVLAMSELGEVCRKENVGLGIITVPASGAQTAADELIACGITAIWNFAPTILKVPDGILVENENLASSLAVLSKHLSAGDRACAGDRA